MTISTTPAAGSGTITLGGDLTVNRLGFGTMQLTGPGVWGEPRDRAQAVRVLRRAAESGVEFFDTADSYGPFVAEELVREALQPYDGVTIATKGGFTRTGPDEWHALGRPDYLRQCVEMSLRRLGVERIELYQLHRIDPQVPLADQLGALKDLQDAGKIRHVGLSEVSVAELEAAREIVDIVSVQNLYNLVNRQAEALLDRCERERIAFIPWFPLATGGLAKPGGPLDEIAAEHDATPSQLALAWLLHRSPVMLPIPGTSSVVHLEQNVAAGALQLSDHQTAVLETAGKDAQ